jgi:diguanylate cyclase (GGDEF)-like protein
LAGRLGGEEFAVMLTLADQDGACVVAQRIQRRLATQALVCGQETIPLTVSIGVTELRMDDADAEAALSRSDQALYRAKKNGRNRIECA